MTKDTSWLNSTHGESNLPEYFHMTLVFDTRLTELIPDRSQLLDSTSLLPFIYDTSTWQDRLIQLQLQHVIETTNTSYQQVIRKENVAREEARIT
jgi:hypothetical protein